VSHGEANIFCLSELIQNWTQGKYILMQYTGLKDRNGREIYEGDILGILAKPSLFGTAQVCFGEYGDSEIEWGSPAIGWYATGVHGYHREDGRKDVYETGEESLLWYDNKWEVIGNIYENPELMEKQ
jgi:uncharacterized phage protein (TIGR01671 family)